MTPVEAGSTWVTGNFSILASAPQVAMATRSPVRVAQFALPALIRMAPTCPREARRCSFDSRTGEACTRFCVNTPAAAAGTPETMSARSSLACLRIPAYTAE